MLCAYTTEEIEVECVLLYLHILFTKAVFERLKVADLAV